MTEHLNDEQLDDLERYVKAGEVLAWELYEMLRSERAAHQATRAELERQEEQLVELKGLLYLSGKLNQLDITRIEMDTEHAARAGQGEGEQ